MEMPASLPGKERGQSVKAEAFVCIPHVKDKGTAVDVEVLPLVLCNDCKFGAILERTGMPLMVTCKGEDHELCWFCADGERKDSNDRS